MPSFGIFVCFVFFKNKISEGREGIKRDLLRGEERFNFWKNIGRQIDCPELGEGLQCCHTWLHFALLE